MVSPTINWDAKSYWFIRLDVATGVATERRLLTHWEASDINHSLTLADRDVRYVLEP